MRPNNYVRIHQIKNTPVTAAFLVAFRKQALYFDCRVNKFIGWIQENIQKFSLPGEELF
jgi:hypothetical protein